MTDPTPPIITRADLAEHLVATGAMTKKTALNALGDLIDVMSRYLRAGASIYLKGLGRLEVVATPERPCRNPRTGEPFVVPARRRVKFKPSKLLLLPPPRGGRVGEREEGP